MKRNGFVVLFAMLLSAPHFEARGRDGGYHGGGYHGGGGFAPFRQPGAIMGPGIRGHGVGRPGAVGFGVGRRGSGVRWSWPLYGSGLGIYYSTPVQSQDYDTAPDAGNPNSPSVYYYQKPAKPDVITDCKDAWTTKGSSSSLGNFMNRVFELQCQNRHPEPEAKHSQAPEPAKN
jgi:hypothetical protein